MPSEPRIYLRILLVEDNPDDAALVIRELRKGGIEPEWTRVETEPDYRKALNEDLDLVIADYDLPNFSGPRAMEILKESGLPVPLIVVTGAIGEERAAAVMRSGAADYFLKDRLVRLAQAVRQIMDQGRVGRERAAAEESLRKGAERFRQVVENIDEVFWMTDRSKGQIVYISPGYEKVWGRSTASLYDNPSQMLDMIHPDDRERVGLAASSQDGSYDIEYRVVRDDGSIRWIHDRAFPVRDAQNQPYRIAGVAADITRRRIIEEQNRANEQSLRLFRALIDRSTDSFEVLDPATGEFLDVNEQGHKELGYSREEFLKLKVFDIDPAITPPEFHALVNDAHIDEGLTWEGIHKRKDGSTFPVEVMLRRVRFEKDYIVAVVRDTTHRRAAEQQLLLQSTALAAAANAMMITNHEGKIEWVNTAFSKSTGFSPEEAIGREPGEFLKSGIHDQGHYRGLWNTILAGGVWNGEMVNKSKDGHLIHQETTITPVKNEKGVITHFIAVNQDVTKRKSLEESLRQSQKMEAIGRLSGGIAHDFNNILTVILGHVAILEMEDLEKTVSDSVQAIKKGGERAANLTRQLLLFARRQAMEMQLINLNDSVIHLIGMLGRIIGEDIQITLRCADERMIVKADGGMLDQVLMNLAVNARDAMPKGGRLLIGTERIDIDDDAARDAGLPRGRYVVLFVTDTGHGIPPEIMGKIFDPFFTTKDTGKGTGLGLATVFGIVEQHGGSVRVTSAVGGGATFRIFLPAADDASTLKGETITHQPSPRGTEVILVVEDEPDISSIISKYLRQLGYTVFTASNGPEALGLWEEKSGRIDLVITDIVMPGGMNGIELGGMLKTRSPALPVIFSSGYSDLVAAGDFPLKEGENFIPKPYALSKVATTVRTLLDALK